MAPARYTYVIDDAGVIDKNPSITPVGDFEYRVKPTTNPT
jgi:hypothetical protein